MSSALGMIDVEAKAAALESVNGWLAEFLSERRNAVEADSPALDSLWAQDGVGMLAVLLLASDGPFARASFEAFGAGKKGYDRERWKAGRVNREKGEELIDEWSDTEPDLADLIRGTGLPDHLPVPPTAGVVPGPAFTFSEMNDLEWRLLHAEVHFHAAVSVDKLSSGGWSEDISANVNRSPSCPPGGEWTIRENAPAVYWFVFGGADLGPTSEHILSGSNIGMSQSCGLSVFRDGDLYRKQFDISAVAYVDTPETGLLELQVSSVPANEDDPVQFSAEVLGKPVPMYGVIHLNGPETVVVNVAWTITISEGSPRMDDPENGALDKAAARRSLELFEEHARQLIKDVFECIKPFKRGKLARFLGP